MQYILTEQEYKTLVPLSEMSILQKNAKSQANMLIK